MQGHQPAAPAHDQRHESARFRAQYPSAYIRAVKNLTIFLKRSPGAATAEDLRAFHLRMSKNGVRPPTIALSTRAAVARRALERLKTGRGYPRATLAPTDGVR